MKVVVKEPQKPARVCTIPEGLKPLQKLVGGHIEGVCELSQYRINIWINEEGKVEQLAPNLVIYNNQDFIASTAIFVGFNDEGKDVDLSDEQVKIVLDYCKRHFILFPFDYDLE